MSDGSGMLAGKVGLVTGGASGIGKGAALRLASEGAAILIADMQEDDGAAVVAEIEQAGGRAKFIKVDISNPPDVQAAVEAAVQSFGQLNIVFANAGINGVWAPIEELQPDEWDKTLGINLKGTYLTVHFAIPYLRQAGGGSIVITSSVNGNRTFSTAGASAYSSSKAAQVAFMKMAALELGRYNIRVNAICPGAIKTNIDERTRKRDTEEVQTKIEVDKHAFIDEGQGDITETADVVLFLASSLSRHVSGVEIYVDGGASLVH